MPRGYHVSRHPESPETLILLLPVRVRGMRAEVIIVLRVQFAEDCSVSAGLAHPEHGIRTGASRVVYHQGQTVLPVVEHIEAQAIPGIQLVQHPLRQFCAIQRCIRVIQHHDPKPQLAE